MIVKNKDIKLFVFNLLCVVLCYGFTLTNFSLSIDNEQVFSNDASLALGRWGTNFIRCKVFDGITPYFTLLLSVFFLAITAVLMSNFFKFKKIYSYLFGVLFLTFPQMAYQLIFTMQADAVAIGFFVSIVSIVLFVWTINHLKLVSFKSFLYLFFSAFLITFAIAVYQALIFLPITIFVIYIFQNTFKENYSLKKEVKTIVIFGFVMLVAGLLYYISLKLFCSSLDDGGYLASYASNQNNSRFIDFYNLLVDNFRGDFYYGDKPFLFVFIISLILIIIYAFKKTLFLVRFLLISSILILPFFISIFITNGSHPPRLYVASNLVFAFIIIHFISSFKFKNIGLILVTILSLANIYFVTLLFLSNYKICNHDQQIARKVDSIIYAKYPNFDSSSDYVYFYGSLPDSEHDRFKLPKSEIFGGSFYCWDGGSNNRIINFIKFYDIAHYREIDNKEVFLNVVDSIESIPIWPNPESVRKIKNVIIVRLGKEKGSKLSIE